MESINKNEASDEALYTNDFLYTIVEAFWLMHRRSIIKLVVLPFTCYALMCLIFLPHLLYDHGEAFMGDIRIERFIKVLLYTLLVYMSSFEMIQLADLGCLYLASIPNLIDIGSYVLNLWLLVTHDLFYDTWRTYPSNRKKILPP